jgi:hypothetical protein
MSEMPVDGLPPLRDVTSAAFERAAPRPLFQLPAGAVHLSAPPILTSPASASRAS